MYLNSIGDVNQAIDQLGFDEFWQLFITSYLHKSRPDLVKKPGKLDFDPENIIFEYHNLGELYEITLEHVNKISKKELGQYYTPKDVSAFMAKQFIERLDDQNVADVCCGTGNLIIAVFDQLNKDKVYEILANNRLYLYDLDKTAADIAVMKICIAFVPTGDTKLFKNILNHVSISIGNFLKETINLPKKCFVISNPPYGKLPSDMEVWSDSETIKTKDMYSIFMEKMAKQSEEAVIISPQSYLGSSKFACLRDVLSRFGGKVWSFDNVPSTIFNGRKKGIFNTNTANSVRAAITVVDKSKKGFRVSPMIRFRAGERSQLFDNLSKLLGKKRNTSSQPWLKTPKTLESLVAQLEKSDSSVSDFIEIKPNAQNEAYKITVPSTPRYFITGCKRELNRGSKIVIYAKDKQSFDLLYVLINSTFSYLWWRINDGGITLTQSTLLKMPVPITTSKKLASLAKEGVGKESDYLVGKMNAGKNNENIKFPSSYRQKLNKHILAEMKQADLMGNLYSIHFNNLAEVLPYWI